MADLSLIKKLREATGCGIADCNKALAENADDFEKSVDWLRKKGLASASKKTGRVASEGLVAVYIDGLNGSVIEVNSETDFVARNDKFQNFVAKVSKEALQYGDDISKFQSDKDEEVKSQIGVIGENINIRRIASLKVNKGLVVSYIHNSVSENMGKIAVLLAFESVASVDKLSEIGKQIAMHIAATKPDALNIESVDPAKLSREIEVLKEQARATGKPENIIEKMMEGRIRKYYEEVVLLEQAFVMDDKLKIKDLVANFAKQNGDTKISGFKLYILGEGLEKKENNFAQEVASMTS
ncbi:MAG: elongation factor Ts [Proteobacteria bacterium]|nr:elongation factor Ts [Pseudomonadota bacterium]NCA28189.1 elongation factor Ts [Pseudomonadota bacterium]